MNDYPEQPAGAPVAPDTALTPAELLRLAAEGRREYASGKSVPEDWQKILLTEYATFMQAAALVENPANLWEIIPTWMPVPTGKIDPRRSR